MDSAPRHLIVSRDVLERLERRAYKFAWYAAIAGLIVGLALVPAAAWIRELVL